MTAVALALVQEVLQAGGTVRLDGKMLRLSAPEPLPDDLRARLRQHKAEIVALLAAAEPAHDAASVPVADDHVGQDLAAEVADGVRAILAADGAQGVPPNRWPQIQRDTRHLVKRRWLHRALKLGWSTADLFGGDQRAPWHRLDRSGLVLLLGGHEIIELTADMATIRTSSGSVLRYRRRPPAEPPLALLWEVLTSRVHRTGWLPARATGPPIRAPTAHPSEGADGGDVLGGTPPPSLTTITHEGTIMAASTLRALRSEASAISAPVVALTTGNPSGTAILALDLGQKTGWAVRNVDGAIASGTALFKPGRFEGGGMVFLRFRAWLQEVDETAGGIGAFYFEEVRSHRGVAAAHAYGGFLAHLTAWAEANKIPYRGVPVATIKRHVTGRGNADKDAVIAAVRALGFHPADDNEADALALLDWALKTGGAR